MMMQQQGIARPKMPDLPKATNKDGLNDKKEDRQSITIQFGTLPPVLANNYLLANEFKSKENEEVERENDEEEACMLECGEGIGQTSRDVYEKEDDDGMTDIKEEIDLEIEKRRRSGVSHNNLLKQLYQEGVREVDLLGESYGRSFDYYVLYGTPKRKVRVPRFEK
ncbi:hypothetical protein Adt_20664 [Abeliophyllum distichum]|uniref:Uncharacterized protein n=1 Tax=Abeliophyllum distichum TaxID=126358 RepID=A0ABD1SX92_9LAMI